MSAILKVPQLSQHDSPAERDVWHGWVNPEFDVERSARLQLSFQIFAADDLGSSSAEQV